MDVSYQTNKKSLDNLYSYKVVILGDSGVGKTSFTLRYTQNEFNKYQESTIGAAFSTKLIEDNGDFIKFEIWDTAGQERYESLAPMYYRGAKVAIVMFDITQQKTFVKAQKWISELYETTDNIIIVLAGNKYDLDEKRNVSKTTVEYYCNQNNICYIETSAKNDYNIEETFKIIASKVTRDADSLYKSKNMYTTSQNKNKCC